MKFKNLLKYIPPTIPVFLIFLYVGLLFLKPGYIVYTDVTEGLKIDTLYQRYIYTYSNDIGEALPEKARVPIFFFIFLIYKLTNLDPSWYNKIKILITLLATFFTYFWCMKSLLKRAESSFDSNKYAVFIASLSGALFYLVNFWMTNRIMHFHLFFSSVTIPITFLLLFKYFYEAHSRKSLLLLVLVLAVFTATPHAILFQTLLFFVFTIIFLVGKSTLKEKLTKITGIIGFSFLYLLVNAYWLVPTLVSKATPDAIPSETIVNTISRNTTLTNAIRLTGYFFTDSNFYVELSNKFLNTLQYGVSFVPFLTLMLAVVVYRKKYLGKILGLLFVVATFLASKSWLSTLFYNYLMFDSPIQNFGWIFREYDKFGIFIAFCYSMAISLLIYKAFEQKRTRIIATITFILLVVPHINFFLKTVSYNYIPKEIPTEFWEVNKILEDDPENFNVAWYPGVQRPFWSNDDDVRYYFSNVISAKPTITHRSESIHYLEYLMDIRNISEINLGKALDIMGSKYLLLRFDDYSFSRPTLVSLMTQQAGLELVYESELLNVYKNKNFTGIAKAYTSRIITNKGLEILKDLDTLNISTKNTFIDFTDNPFRQNTLNLPTKYYISEEAYYDYPINKYIDRFVFPAAFVSKVENGSADFWRKSTLKNLNYAESKYFFEDIGVFNSQLDYDNGVLSARNGWQYIKSTDSEAAEIPLTFSNHTNLEKINDTYVYISTPNDFKFEWNIVRSDRFNLNGSSALKIDGDLDIPTDLNAHIKITSYDSRGLLDDVIFIFPQQQNYKIDGIARLSEDAVKADVSIWTASGNKIELDEYSYKIKNLKLKDIKGSVIPLTQSIKVTNTACWKNCTLFVRALISTTGDTLGISVDNKYYFKSETFGPEGLYIWRKMGQVPTLNDTIHIVLQGLKGFNSVNSLVFLTEDEVKNLEASASDIKNLNLQNYPKIQTENEQVTIAKTTQINPTLYNIEVQNPKNLPYTLGFTKQYNQNWVITNEENLKSSVVNGFTNGWSTSENGLVKIEFLPQFFFYIGSAISVVSFLLIVGFIAFNRKF